MNTRLKSKHIIDFLLTLSIISVSLRCVQRNKNKTRTYDKRQACYYCKKLYLKIARHYKQQHEREREVRIALSFPKGSSNRKKQLEKLRLLGNYHHNLRVLQSKKGELIVSRRPSTSNRCNPNDFLPCSYCLGFIRRQELWKHVKSCKFKPENIETPKYQKVQEKSKLLLYPEKVDEDEEGDDDDIDDDNDGDRAKDAKRTLSGVIFFLLENLELTMLPATVFYRGESL